MKEALCASFPSARTSHKQARIVEREVRTEGEHVDCEHKEKRNIWNKFKNLYFE